MKKKLVLIVMGALLLSTGAMAHRGNDNYSHRNDHGYHRSMNKTDHARYNEHRKHRNQHNNSYYNHGHNMSKNSHKHHGNNMNRGNHRHNGAMQNTHRMHRW